MTALAGILAGLLALIHVFATKIRALDIVPRSRWLSGASGISVAYVFIHILPDLAEQQVTLRKAAGAALEFLEHPAYLLALLGMVVFYGLRHDHKMRYRRYGRWLLGAAVIVGWAIGAVTRVHAAVIASLFGFLAGGVILNVLKEELPQERASRFWAFGAGAGAYTVLLLFT